eukprot:scaffold22056_cov52-Phaeocystis_antarctica.AAC.1
MLCSSPLERPPLALLIRPGQLAPLAGLLCPRLGCTSALFARAATAATAAPAAATNPAAVGVFCRRLPGLQLGQRVLGQRGRSRVGGVVRPGVPLVLVAQLCAHLRVRPGPEAAEVGCDRGGSPRRRQ